MMRRRLVVAAVAGTSASRASVRRQTDGGVSQSPPGGGEVLTSLQPPHGGFADVHTVDPADTTEGYDIVNDPIAVMSRSVVDPSGTPEYVAPRGMSAGGGGRGAGGAQPSYTASDISAFGSDPAASLYQEALRDVDPLGGMGVADYYRDPAAGYAPQYAPRDFAYGGALDYPHHRTPMAYASGMAVREAGDHHLERRREEAARTRSALRGSNEDAASAYMRERGEADLDSLTGRNFRRPSDTDMGIAYAAATLPREATSSIPGWSAGDAASTGNSFVSHAAVAASVLNAALRDRNETLHEKHIEDSFAHIHGLRQRDAFEEERATRRTAMFGGYDPTLPNGRTTMPVELPPVISPASMDEAQKAVRENARTPEAELIQRMLSSNTNEQAPAIGAALVDRIISTVEADRRDTAGAREQAFRRANGFGRQRNLVTESGPDQRRQQLHKNDERLYRAAVFGTHEYADGDFKRVRDNDTEMDRNNLSITPSTGVARQLRNKFDVDRRAKTIAEGKQDPLERSEMFLGVPVKQRVDWSVRVTGGRRAERHIDYFKPKPSLEDHQLFQVNVDVQGFPLLRTRVLEPYAYELFARYRAHHQQRVWLALRHGLEPRPNETSGERDARRLALDRLCEATPFDPALMSAAANDAQHPSLNVLRQWFGSYWLPSPSLVATTIGTDLAAGLTLHEARARSDIRFQPHDATTGAANSNSSSSSAASGGNNEAATTALIVDTREHLLSSRYVNRLLCMETLNTRIMRGYVKENLFKTPEVRAAFRTKEGVLKNFTADQRRMYDEYIASEVERHFRIWASVRNGRRYVPSRGEFGTPSRFITRRVVVVQSVANGEETCISEKMFAELEKSTPNGAALMLDGNTEVTPVPGPNGNLVREMSFVEVKFGSGSSDPELMMESEWNTYAEETTVADPNAHISNELTPFPYNRVNYIETQDFLWEARVGAGEEGWTTAVASDGLRVGLPVLAARPLSSSASTSFGEPERAVVVQFEGQPFYNPEPKTVTVRFNDDSTAEVPLEHVRIWQTTRTGPKRTAPLETREHPGQSNRFVDFADPRGRSLAKEPHFLDVYRTKSRAQHAEERVDRLRNVRDVDAFNRIDMTRGENHRLINSKHRRDHIMGGYFHRYTPWEYIAVQEMDQPHIIDKVRSDDTGPAYFHGPNKFWTRKRRPFGYVKNFAAEVRDFFQYVDGVTPWDKAKKIRAHWETREHHPTPYFNRPTLAMHRNDASIVPSSLLDLDQKTGEITGLKDSLREYRPTREAPEWTAL